ncbi:MAG: tRNA (cytidine(34)-2'-O)-methyltransferase [Lentisphaeria bacterium]|jgi:tRNA (cytidine/uridine-2'-O-)-methyltransferase
MPAAGPFNIVLVAPEIPQNTGTIGRLCVCTAARLHLIRPLGFQLDAAHLRRAGLDYWQFLDLTVHEDWEAFLAHSQPATDRLFLLSSKAQRTFWNCAYRPGDWLVFGSETQGLPPALLDRYPDRLATIPMPGTHARSHNLANAAAIVLYEALRQTTTTTRADSATPAAGAPAA